MKQYLVYSEGSSNKFWSISTLDNSYTVVYGKVGTNGQTQTKTFASAQEAEKQAQSQMSAKIKKGYQTATPPEGFGDVTPTDNAPKTTPVKAAKQAAAKSSPATVKDDGTLKPWHQEDSDFWEYSWHCPDEDSFTFEALSQPEKASAASDKTSSHKAKVAQKQDKPALYWGGNDFDNDDDDDDSESGADSFNSRSFARIAYNKPLPELQKAWDKAKAAGTDEKTLQRALDQSLERIFTWSLYLDGLKNLPWLFAQGGKLRNDGDFEAPYAKCCWDKYVHLKPDEYTKVADSLDKFLHRTYDDIAIKLADGLRTIINAIAEGKYEDGSGIERLPDEEELNWCSGFRLRSYQDRCYIYPITKDSSPKSMFRRTCEQADDIDDTVAAQYLPQKLRPLIEKMGQEGLFDTLPLPKVSIEYYDTSEVFCEKVIDQKAVEKRLATAEILVKTLEESEQFEDDALFLEDAVTFLLNGPLERDLPRTSALIGRFLYSANTEAEKAANTMLCRFDDHYPQLQHDRALWLQANGSYKPAYNVMGFAAEKGYAPAAKKLKEFEQLARQRALLVAKTASPAKKTSGKRKVDFSSFTESDLFIDTENIIARADSENTIRIRFKAEGEEGYSEALDYLNNLLEKGYARLDDGYTLLVRFLQKPVFIKLLPGFPKNTCHAFFAKAVEYPALHEKIRRYADLALVEFDWYKDLDGEENTIPGTFAACALALYDASYIHMAGQYARFSDNEHQYIQLEVAPALLKAYGPTPEVAKAIFDISSSNGQDGSMGRLSKELYLLPENLSAVMEHIESGTSLQHHLEYHMPGYVEAIMGDNVKSNLKKLVAAAKAAAPKDQKIFEDFYNSYKNYSSKRDEEDYGNDLSLGTAVAANEITLPEYNEPEPTVLTLAEFEAKYPDRKIDYESPLERRTGLFIPHAIDNPYLAEYAFKQWSVLSKIAREAPSSFFWYPYVMKIGNWVVNFVAPARQCGAIMLDGKNKPIVLYGKLNLVPLFSRFHKRPFKSLQEAETARLANLLEEAPEYRAITKDEEDASKRYEDVADTVLVERHYAAGILLSKFKPEDGRFYDAALIQRAILANRMVDPESEKAAYEELSVRRPEFAEYWQEKLRKLV